MPKLSDTPTGDEQAAYDLALAQRNAAEDLAVQVLWALSGRQFGLCETVVRPCPEVYIRDGFERTSHVLTREGGHWFNWACGCLGGCTVTGPRVVHLPGPAAEITAVMIDGEALPEDGYQLEGDALYRRGGGVWPRQDLGRPLGDAGTWSVTYLRGYPVPAGVDVLTGVLAKEFLSACSSGEKCRLPRSVRATVRQGVTYQVYDPKDMFANGKTGLAEVDLWLASVNPNALMEAPTVL